MSLTSLFTQCWESFTGYSREAAMFDAASRDPNVLHPNERLFSRPEEVVVSGVGHELSLTYGA